MRLVGCVLAVVTAIGGGAAAAASAPGDDPSLVPLLLTVADLPSGWQSMAVPPLQAEPSTAGAADDPCNALAHVFDTAYAGPHAATGFSSGGLNLITDIVFRLPDSTAASGLVTAYSADLTACPTVTGPDGLTTTYTPIACPALGDATAAYRGTWRFANFVVLFVTFSVDDTVITLEETGAGEDTTLLQQLAAVSADRATPVQWSK